MEERYDEYGQCLAPRGASGLKYDGYLRLSQYESVWLREELVD